MGDLSPAQLLVLAPPYASSAVGEAVELLKILWDEEQVKHPAEAIDKGQPGVPLGILVGHFGD